MTHAQLEHDLATWLRAEATAATTPDALRRRVLDIPGQMPGRTGWLRRFWPVLAVPAASASAVATVVAAVLFLGLFDAPPGADGEACNRRQSQAALDAIRDAEGYRYALRTQRSDLDPDAPLSLDNPRWAWLDETNHDGAYLAPDRFREVVSRARDGGGPSERLQVGDLQWERSDLDGAPAWVQHEAWPTANVAWGYIVNSMPTAMIPGVSTLGFDGGVPPQDFPGTGGCIVAATIPEDQRPDTIDGQPVIIPEGMIPMRTLAMRVDVATGRPTVVVLGPSEIDRRDLTRTVIALEWLRPDESEFIPPTDAIPDDSASRTPPPDPTPLVLSPDAWDATLADGGDAGNAMVFVGAVAAGGDRSVAVGTTAEATDWRASAWISDDGVAWRSAAGPAEWAMLGFQSIAWDGREFLAVGSRSVEATEPGSVPLAVGEVWRSPDGETWTLAGPIADGAQPSALIAAGPGWILTGSVAVGELNTRPAIWASEDGAEWSEVELPGTASGRVGTVVDDGNALTAVACESPVDPEVPSADAFCVTRLWTSPDGTTWTAGAVLDIELYHLAVVDDGLLAIGADPRAPVSGDPEGIGGTVYTSSDGTSWAELRSFPLDASPWHIHRLEREIVVTGARMNFDSRGGYPVAFAWRSSDGVTWESIELGLPDGAIGSQAVGVTATDGGLTFFGHVMVSEVESFPAVWTEP